MSSNDVAKDGAIDPPRPKVDPTEQLPTPRVAFDKQLRCLLAYAFASDNGAKAVSIEEVAKAVGLNSSTVSLCNPFFVKVGFLEKQSREFMPSREVLEMARASQWDAERAAEKLAPIVQGSWFSKALEPRLRLGPLPVSDAIVHLADRASAGRDHEAQLGTLLEYMRASGLVRRENDHIAWVATRDRSPEPQVAEKPTAERPAPPRPASGTTTGGVQMNVNIDVDMEKMKDWSPERIAAFFKGLAEVMAAQRGDPESTDKK